MTPEIGSIAIETAMIYGKAVGHPADLNFGDCFSYACAKAMNIALEYNGDAFALTDRLNEVLIMAYRIAAAIFPPSTVVTSAVVRSAKA
ncbi:hypothetical protein [Pararhizobium sp. PWRC1-1]|uniref:hypothetical protein n=1 Tax=Pararhizobium sp. PWRC1-1 TaxID=2804566 RepID=UPI003CE9DB20